MLPPMPSSRISHVCRQEQTHQAHISRNAALHPVLSALATSVDEHTGDNADAERLNSASGIIVHPDGVE